MQNLKNKPFQQVPGGEYDPNGFYYTPDGSFWDPDGVYFNSEGFDVHGGYFDGNLEYTPGPGWIHELMCYEDEKEETLKQMGRPNRGSNLNNLAEVEEDHLDEDADLYDIYEEIDYEKLIQEEEKKNNLQNPTENSNENKQMKFFNLQTLKPFE